MAKHFPITIKQLPTPSYPKNEGFMLRPHQREQYDKPMTRLRAYIAAGGSGKSVTQEACAVREMRESGFMQRQIIAAPTSQVCNQFAAETRLRLQCTDACYKTTWTCDHAVMSWHIRPTFNLAHDTTKGAIDRLEKFIMRPYADQKAIAKKLKATGTFDGLVVTTTHAAIARVLNERILPKVKSGQYTKTQVKRAVTNLTNRCDESHKIGGFGCETEDQNGLGSWLSFCYQHGDKSSRVFLTTATPYRENLQMIAGDLYKKFSVSVMPLSEWLPFSGIEELHFVLQEYDEATPLKAIAKNVGKEPNEKHLGIQPSEGTKWMKGRDKIAMSLRQRKLVTAALPKGKVIVDTVNPLGRRAVKRALRTDTAPDYLQTNMCVREGVDIPAISRIHHGAMENSKSLAVQTLYRGLRPFPGKKRVVLRYYVPRLQKVSRIKTREEFSTRVNLVLLISNLRDIADPLFSSASFKQLAKYLPDAKKKKIGLEDIFTALHLNGDEIKEAVYLGLDLLKGEKTKAAMLAVINDALADAGVSKGELSNCLLADYLMNLDEDCSPKVAAKIQKMKFALAVDPMGYITSKFDGIKDDGVGAFAGNYTVKCVKTLTSLYAKYKELMQSAISKLKKAKLPKKTAYTILTPEELSVAKNLLAKKKKEALSTTSP